MIQKPRKRSSFDTRFIIWSVFAISIYHYGVKFILVDTQYVLRTPYVAASSIISYMTNFLLKQPHQMTCPIAKNSELHNHLPSSSVPVLQYFDTGHARTIFIPKHTFNIGDIVVRDNYLVGRITKTGKHIASVQLITDQTSFIPVTVDGVNGIASGIDGQMLQINRLQTATTTNLSKKEVYTSGIDGVYPKNLLVGFVVRNSHNKIRVKNCLDFKKLDHVTIFSYGITP